MKSRTRGARSATRTWPVPSCVNGSGPPSYSYPPSGHGSPAVAARRCGWRGWRGVRATTHPVTYTGVIACHCHSASATANPANTAPSAATTLATTLAAA